MTGKTRKALSARECEYCGERFTPRVRDYARFCKPICRAAQWNIDNPRMKKVK